MNRVIRKMVIGVSCAVLIPAAFCVLIYGVFFFSMAIEESRDPTVVNESVVRSLVQGDLGLGLNVGGIAGFYDDHGGWLGDGETYIEIHDDTHQIAAEIAQRDDWSPMPVSRDVRILVYGIIERGEDIVTHYGPTLTNRNRKPWIPEIEHGFWILVDRQSETEQSERRDPDRPSGIHNRYSYNLTVGIYDTDHSILYVLALDT